MELSELTKRILDQAREKGWGATPEEIDVTEKMALIHSEVSEAYEAYRKKNMDGKHGFNEELGDIITRVLHLCGILGIDAEAEITKKLDANESRTWDFKATNEKAGGA